MRRQQLKENEEERMKRKIQARNQPKQRESGQLQSNMSFREARRTAQNEEEFKDDSGRGNNSKVIKTMGAAIL